MDLDISSIKLAARCKFNHTHSGIVNGDLEVVFVVVFFALRFIGIDHEPFKRVTIHAVQTTRAGKQRFVDGSLKPHRNNTLPRFLLGLIEVE